MLLYILIPWSAINLTDYYFIRRGDYDVPSFFTPAGRYRGFLWPGLVAYLLAVAAQPPFIAQTFYTGPLVATLGGVDISWIVGGVAGGLLSACAPVDQRTNPVANHPRGGHLTYYCRRRSTARKGRRSPVSRPAIQNQSPYPRAWAGSGSDPAAHVARRRPTKDLVTVAFALARGCR